MATITVNNEIAGVTAGGADLTAVETPIEFAEGIGGALSTAAPATGDSEGIEIYTGDSADGDSGDIEINTGLAPSGTRGSIILGGTVSTPEMVKIVQTKDDPQVISASSYDIVLYDDFVQDNTDGAFVGSAFTVPVDGNYDIRGTVTATTANAGVVFIGIFVDGAETRRMDRKTSEAGEQNSYHVSAILPLTAGQVVTIRISNETTGDLTTDAFFADTHLSIYQVP